jgi:hypothetical protein
MNKKTNIFLIILSLITFISCNNNKKANGINKNAPFYSNEINFGHPRFTKNYDSIKFLNYYPFIAYNDDNYMILAEIESIELFDKYTKIFEAHGYSGSGYCWEGHIKQILKIEKPELLNFISFDSETGGFYMYTSSKEKQIIIVEYLSKIFSDTLLLNKYLEKANRAKIND